MKVLTAYVASFVCFWTGHGISRVMNNRVLYWLYPAYSRLMLASCDVEDWAGIEFMWRVPIKAGLTDPD